jgi:hypothetical protein
LKFIATTLLVIFFVISLGANVYQFIEHDEVMTDFNITEAQRANASLILRRTYRELDACTKQLQETQ